MRLTEKAQRIQYGLATEADFADMKREDILAIKGDQSDAHYRFISCKEALQMIRSVGGDESEVRFRHVASDESVDSMGDIISVKGWMTERFQKNPVLLWAHDQRNLPIGTVERVWKGKNSGQPALLTESAFLGADLNPHADMVRGLVEAGVLPGVSVGFIPQEMRFPESEAERKELGLGPWGVLHVKQELLELSVVPVPANGNALRQKSLELADSVFSQAEELGWDKSAVEELRHVLNLDERSERDYRRRTIIVPEGARARLVEPVTKATDPEPQPETPPNTKTEPSDEMLAAVTKLTASVEALAARLDADGDPAPEVTTTVTEPEPKAADPVEDLSLDEVVEGAIRSFKQETV